MSRSQEAFSEIREEFGGAFDSIEAPDEWVHSMRHGTDDLLAESVALIRAFVDAMPLCTCIDAYKSRNLTDPQCFRCDLGGYVEYRKLVQFALDNV